MCLSVADPDAWKGRIRCAGGLFLGERSFEVLGDYTAGPSHVMPTGGTARFASPLNVLDFVRLTNIIALDEKTAAAISPHAETIARAEGLDSHAEAARLRQRRAGERGCASRLRFLPGGRAGSVFGRWSRSRFSPRNSENRRKEDRQARRERKSLRHVETRAGKSGGGKVLQHLPGSAEYAPAQAAGGIPGSSLGTDFHRRRARMSRSTW